MQILRADTITEVTIGPVVAVGDGFTPVTTLSIASADEAEIIKHGATTNTAISGTLGAISNADGYYALDLSAADTDTEGRFVILINDDSLALPVRQPFMVMNANAYDALYAAAGTDYLQTDMLEISGDSLAADNLEATYDGSGYVDGAAPATQTAVSNITTSSAAISATASSVVVTTGTETLTYTATVQLDGTLHEVADVTNNTEFYYEFLIGGNGVPAEFLWDGYAQSNGDSYAVKAYNWDAVTWDQIGSIPGSNSTNIVSNTFQATRDHVGTIGVDKGKVGLQFTSSDGTHFVTDRVLCSYAVVTQSVGYALGRIWINTVSGTAGTEAYVNGVADNPVATLADAKTIADNLGILDFHVSSDSTITLSAALNGYNMYGVGYALNFGGQDCGGTHFFHASPVNGTVLAASGHVDILDSIIDTVTVDESHFTNCSFLGTVTLGAVASDVKVIDCRSVISGASTPVFDYGTSSAVNHNMTFANYHNGLEVRNFNNQGTDLFSLSGIGQLIEAATCSGAMNVRGAWKITQNGTSTFNYDDIRTGTPTAAQLLYMVENAATGVPVTFTTAGGSTTAAVLNLVDGSAADPTNDQYNGRLLFFTDGSLEGSVTDITDYVGSTKTATISVINAAPTSTHNARLI